MVLACSIIIQKFELTCTHCNSVNEKKYSVQFVELEFCSKFNVTATNMLVSLAFIQWHYTCIRPVIRNHSSCKTYCEQSYHTLSQTRHVPPFTGIPSIPGDFPALNLLTAVYENINLIAQL